MVHIKDDGVFDAPVEKIWRYINDEHAHSHGAVKVTGMRDQSANGLTLDLEVKRPRRIYTHGIMEDHHEPTQINVDRSALWANERLKAYAHLHPNGPTD